MIMNGTTSRSLSRLGSLAAVGLGALLMLPTLPVAGQAPPDSGSGGDEKALHESCAALDGRDQRLLSWITKSGLVALIADNYAVEAFPARPCEADHCASLPIHEHCLFKLGVNLGEIWYLTEIADWLRAHGRYRFLLTAPPLRLPGAVGSPATPVGTV